MAGEENSYDRLLGSLDGVDSQVGVAIRAAQEIMDENASLYARVQDFEDAVNALRLLHNETHQWAFSVCDNDVCKLFRGCA